MAKSSLLAALEPAQSAIVEACAGSGKTWLLVSRMLRLLLAGASPSELLAITFTRKAAEEMRARLDEWLQDLALLPDPEAIEFLMQRGLVEAEARVALPRARGLLEAVLTARPGPLITTFHGWFFHLLDHAPLSQRVNGEVVEHPALLGEEAWFDFTESLGRKHDAPESFAFTELAGHFPLASLRTLLDDLLERRAEWWAYGGDHSQACGDLAAMLGVKEDEPVLADFFAISGRLEALQEYATLVARNGAAGLAGDLERAEVLVAAMDALENARTAPPSSQSAPSEKRDALEAAFDRLESTLLTQKGEPLSRKPGPSLDKRLGANDANRYLELHYALAEAVQRCAQRRAEQRALMLNRLALTAGLAYLDTYQRLKSEQGALDFTDAELEVARLLADEASAAAVYLKLDARWKHLLLDEFQDTNPLQWRILRAWLEAYGQDGSRPTVFLVGDPKQSIYRFRRAEPRLFQAAGDWLTTRYGARRFPQNETRRCAPRVVAWVNAVFGQRQDYPGFEPHTAHPQHLPGWCEVHAVEAGDTAPDPPLPNRPPLTTPPLSLPPRRALEAAWVAHRIQAIVGHLEIAADPPRPARYGDITLLYAKRAEIQVFEDAFKAAGIPFITDRRGELLATLEARDLTALLTCLVDSRDDLALAHALKSPLFGLSDDHLLALAQGEDPSWWERLEHWSTQADAPDAVVRAAGLLADWNTLAGTLPVHDLLDRIYYQANVSAHYESAVAARMQATVQANLEGFLGLSLSLSGGRYPSLPRFLDELRRLREQAGQDGPDEPPAASGDRVRMLTIHSAKGLESPVVFLIKADATAGREASYGVLLDWPPDSDRPTHFSLYGPRDWRGPGRDALFRQEKTQAEVERLNLLYVAMTRARQALFVSGLGQEKEDETSWLSQLSAALAATDLGALPQMTWQAAATAAQPGQAPPPLGPVQALPPIGARRPGEAAEALYGTLLHAWLEHHTNGMDEAAIRTLLNLEASVAEDIAATARRMLAQPELAPAFDPGRYLRAHNELEFLDPEGHTARMDRLVEFEQEVWVLDYKSGGLDEAPPRLRAEIHAEQMARYRSAAQALFPAKAVRTVLVFGDGQALWL